MHTHANDFILLTLSMLSGCIGVGQYKIITFYPIHKIYADNFIHKNALELNTENTATHVFSPIYLSANAKVTIFVEDIGLRLFGGCKSGKC